MDLKLIVCGLIVMTASSVEAQRIVAHRGASNDAPENTLAAFQLAWEQGADAIEGDFYLTQDQQIVCIHDDKTKRTSGEDYIVSKSTFDALRKLDVGRWKDPRFTGEKIPTLSEVLATIPPGKQIYIEVKCGPEIVPFLLPVLKQSGLSPEQTVVISFNQQVIAETRRQIPEIQAYWLVGFRQNKETKVSEPSLESILQTAAEIQTQGIDLQANRDRLNDDFVKQLRDRKLSFHVWTVNAPADALHFQKLGVDSITTDRPAYLRQELNLQKN
ncbi:glycerophosphodiester phosphodiesterase [Schlesneria sp.]|uniref:glycerophosphodiester phosphodiesterase n=1 Tax=Schlesneria sp. TaxID=2762018 RepID=UPI002F1A2AD3